MQWLARYLMADSGSPPCVRCAWFLIRRSVGWSVCLSPLPDRRTNACRHRGEEAFRGCAAMVRWPPGAVFGQSAAGCAMRGRGGRARVGVGLRSCSGGSVRPPPHGFRTCSRRLRGAALRGAVFSVRCGAQPLLRAGRSLRSLPVRPMPPDDCLQRISAKCGRPT